MSAPSRVRPKRCVDLVDREVDGERVLLDEANGRIHRLNATAAFIWERCDGDTEVEELAAALADEFGRSAQEVRPDVEVLLRQLESLGLLEEGTAG